MIKPLYDIAEITFPVTGIDKKLYKTPSESDDKSDRIYFGSTYVLKNSKSLFDAFALTNTFVPETCLYLADLNSLLANAKKAQNLYLLDSKFNVFIPQKFIKLQYKTYNIFKEYEKYIRIKEYTYLFEKLIDKPSEDYKPLFCKVNNVIFFIGWNEEPLNMELRL